MKKLLLFAVLFLATKTIFAQIEWQKNYGLPNLDETLNFIFPAAEKGHFWVAGKTSSVGQDDFLILKMDSLGNVVWADTLGSEAHNERIWGFFREPTTGEMWLAGSRTDFEKTETRGVLMKLTAEGAVIFEKISTISVEISRGFGSVIGFADGSAAAVFSYNSNGGGYLLRLDASGAEIFSEPIPNGSLTSLLPQKLAPLPDGRFYFFNNIGSVTSVNAVAELSLREPSGAVVWKKSIHSPTGEGRTSGRNMAADPTDGETFLVTQQNIPMGTFFTKIAADGSEIWSVPLPNFIFSMRVKLAPGNLVALVTDRLIELRSAATGALVAVHDYSNGNMDWPRQLNDAIILPSGSGAFVGQTDIIGSADGYFGALSAGSLDILKENFIGSTGPQGDDSGPILAETGGFLFMASLFADHPSVGYEVALRKIDPTDGAEIWSKKYGSPLDDRVHAMVRLADGNLLIVADSWAEFPDTSKVLLLKIDPTDGAVIWETKLANPGLQYGSRATAAADGGAVITFHGGSPNNNLSFQLKTARISATGAVIWQKWIAPTWSPTQTTGQRSLDDVIAMADGDFLAVGMEDERSGLVLKIDGATGVSQVFSLLEPVEKNDDRRATSALETASGDVLIVGPNYRLTMPKDSILMYRLDKNGQIKVRKTLRISDSHYATRLLRASDGGILLILPFNAYSFGNSDGLIVRRINADFETLGETVLFNDYWRPASVAALPDGSLAMAREVTIANSHELLVAKTDALPTVSTGDFSVEKAAFSVAPNPLGATDFLKIELEDAAFWGPFSIEIWTLDGRLFSVFEREKTAARQVFKIEKGLPTGSFFVRILSEKGSSQKLVLRF